MNIKVINTYKDFLFLEGCWNNLLQLSGSDHPHCTFEWLSTWWKHFGKDKELFILVAEEHNEIIGIAPLMIHKLGRVFKVINFRTVSFFGFVDSADFLIRRNREQVISEFFKYIYAKENLWDEVRLRQLSDASPNFDIIKKEIEKNIYNTEINILIACPYLEIEGGGEEYFTGLGKNLKKSIARRARRLNEKNINLEFENMQEIDEKLLSDLYTLNKKRFEVTQHRSLFLDENKFNFIRDIKDLFNQKKWWRLFLLKFNESLICYQICFDYNQTAYFWNTSYDIDYSQFSVGKILMKSIIEYCFEKKYKICDFMVGEEDYKFEWTKSYNTNYQIILRKKNVKTKIALAYLRARSHLKSQ